MHISRRMRSGGGRVSSNSFQTFADSFERADENLEASASWTLVPGVTGGLAVVSNKLNVVDTLSAGSLYYAPDIGSGNQYGEAVWKETLTPASFGVLRYQDLNNFVGYRVLLTGRLIELYKRVAGTLTLITQIWSTPIAGDVVRLELFGTKAVFKVNGIVRGGPYEMGSLFSASTKAGLWGRSGVSTGLWDNFACGKVNSVMVSNGLAVAAYGDSLTAGQQNSSNVFSATSFPAVAQAASGRYFMNGGVPGETSTSIKNRTVAATQSDNMSRIMVIWAGRNNYASTATVMADIASMVAACTSGKYIVMSVLNDLTTDGGTGGVQYGQIVTTLNAANIAVTYPSNYLDIRSTLAALAGPGQLYDNPAHFALDHIPPGLVSDGIVHLNTAGYAIVAAQVNAFIASKGW